VSGPPIPPGKGLRELRKGDPEANETERGYALPSAAGLRLHDRAKQRKKDRENPRCKDSFSSGRERGAGGAPKFSCKGLKGGSHWGGGGCTQQGGDKEIKGLLEETEWLNSPRGDP